MRGSLLLLNVMGTCVLGLFISSPLFANPPLPASPSEIEANADVMTYENGNLVHKDVETGRKRTLDPDAEGKLIELRKVEEATLKMGRERTTFQPIYETGANGQRRLSAVKVLGRTISPKQQINWSDVQVTTYTAPSGGFCSISEPASYCRQLMAGDEAPTSSALDDCAFHTSHFQSYACAAEQNPPPPEQPEPQNQIPAASREENCAGQAQLKKVSCQAALERSTVACNSNNYPQLSQAQQQGQGTVQSLQGQQSTNSSCGQTNQFNQNLISGLQGFQQACTQESLGCSACDDFKNTADSCAGAANMRAEASQNASSCQANRQKAQDAATQIQAAQRSQQDAQACFQNSTASASQADFGKPGAEKDKTSPGQGPALGGTGSVARVGGPVEARAGGIAGSNFQTDFDTSSGLEDMGSSRNLNSFPSSAGASVAAANFALGGGAPTGMTTETSVDASADLSKVAKKNSSSGFMGGGAGRRFLRRPSSEAEARALAEAAKSGKFNPQGPDLRAFLPKMGGQKGKEDFDGHGPHANIFEKIHHRYKAVERSLIRDAQTEGLAP